ncbi:MAG: FmdE family protein [Methylophilaceae bacterium]|jgi:formylmethanofuran dehydrogenase subunit E|nr:FmdE family protein [Methylophilaceae bacterium]
MHYPAFFDAIPAIRLYDPLAEFLGAAGDGVIKYRYLDAVKLAGHSCPTVASAYWMTLRALRALYPDSLPERGNIRVEFGKQADDGVTGVIANVVGLLTGAAADGGFKGIAGAFDRRNKLFFAAGSDFEIRFTRLDTGKIVETAVSMQSVPASPRIWELLPKCRNGSASPSESSEFRQLWQERVRALLLDHAEDAQVFAINLL